MNGAEQAQPSRPPHTGRWRLAWAAMVWERLWPALLPMVLVAVLFSVFSMFGLWSYLPGLVHLALLAIFLCAFCVAMIAGLRTFRLPRRGEVNRRIERDSNLLHRPLETLDDQANAPTDTGGALWRLHQQEAMKAANQARGIVPHMDLPKRDPFAVRGAIGLALLVAVLFAGPLNRDQFARAFDPRFAITAGTPVSVDAWVTPPEYTGIAPLFLSGTAITSTSATSDEPDDLVITVPEDSVFTLRVQGIEVAPTIEALASGEQTPQALTSTPITGASDGYELIQKLDQNLEIKLSGERLEDTNWTFAVRPDENPRVGFKEDVGITNRLALRFVYEASDDYGVEGVVAKIALDKAEQTTDPIQFALPLGGLSPKKLNGQTFRDFTPHPFAGLPVKITIRAVDAKGQEGFSATYSMTMPERAFTHPVARALIEQRKILTLTPEKSALVADVLEAITAYPKNLFDDVAPVLGLSAAAWELRAADTAEARATVSALLWDIALSLEDGDLSLALTDLRAAQQALQQALEQGATDAEIKELTQALREAMNRYLEAMTAQAMENMKNSPQSFSGQPLDQDNMVQSDELQRMLDSIEDMANAGARDAAQQMLSELQNMLENLQAGTPQQMDPNQALMGKALRELSELIARQQELMDQTMQDSQQMPRGSERSPEGERSAPPQEGGQPGERGQDGRQSGEGGDAMAQAQDALRRALGDLMEQLGEADADIPSALGRAEQAMRQSRNALRKGQPGQALSPQRNALGQMRDGAQSLAQELMNAMRQNQPGSGEGDATAQGDGMGGRDRDPLGRPRAQSGADTGDSVKVPGQRSVQTAREILRELRNRASERQRPKDELDYLNRLLDRF